MAAMNLLEDWCRGMDVDIHRALVVTGIPVECGQEEIETTLREFFAPLGPYQVLNKMFLREENAKAVLVEMGEGINLSTIPREFPGRGGVWRVVHRHPTQDADFVKNLHEFLESEGRTVDDVLRLLQLHPPQQPHIQNVPRENWMQTLGVFLGAVVQIALHMDSEMRHLEEIRAQELAVVQMRAAAQSSEAGRKVKEEPRPAAGADCVLKTESSSSWCDTEDEAPKPFFSKAWAKNPCKKKVTKGARPEPTFWKKFKINPADRSTFFEDSEADEAEKMESPECALIKQKLCMKRGEWPLKQLEVKCAGMVRGDRPQDVSSEAESPGGASESDKDGDHDVPPRKKAMGWGMAKRLVPMKKKKKVSLGPVSYVLLGSEGTKKVVNPKKGPGSRKDALFRKGFGRPKSMEVPAPGSQDLKAKQEGFPQTSNDGSDQRSHFERVNKWMMWEEPEWGVEEEEAAAAASSSGGAEGQVGDEESHGSSEEEADRAVGVQEDENRDLLPKSP
ncbi:paraneoplastic antigen-like protein 8A [Orycteropus afer afer]|uniref:Paraneoplastic antigen-like protein 8A n=1 Tax=Orycteropus afer afer TaxID=1230840 RepID=A0A8B7A1I5_ORYAF|nr:paraneoplastic antigen-like protein 8A [Orycteropus afer afer]